MMIWESGTRLQHISVNTIKSAPNCRCLQFMDAVHKDSSGPYTSFCPHIILSPIRVGNWLNNDYLPFFKVRMWHNIKQKWRIVSVLLISRRNLSKITVDKIIRTLLSATQSWDLVQVVCIELHYIVFCLRHINCMWQSKVESFSHLNIKV